MYLIKIFNFNENNEKLTTRLQLNDEELKTARRLVVKKYKEEKNFLNLN